MTRQAGTIIIGLAVVGAIAGPWLAPHDPNVQLLAERLAGPSWSHPLGLDELVAAGGAGRELVRDDHRILARELDARARLADRRDVELVADEAEARGEVIAEAGRDRRAPRRATCS